MVIEFWTGSRGRFSPRKVVPRSLCSCPPFSYCLPFVAFCRIWEGSWSIGAELPLQDTEIVGLGALFGLPRCRPNYTNGTEIFCVYSSFPFRIQIRKQNRAGEEKGKGSCTSCFLSTSYLVGLEVLQWKEFLAEERSIIWIELEWKTFGLNDPSEAACRPGPPRQSAPTSQDHCYLAASDINCMWF